MIQERYVTSHQRSCIVADRDFSSLGPKSLVANINVILQLQVLVNSSNSSNQVYYDAHFRENHLKCTKPERASGHTQCYLQPARLFP
jgi:hypothetical protein